MSCLTYSTTIALRNNNGIRDGTLVDVLYNKHRGRCRNISSLRGGERRDVVLDDLLDFSFHLWGNITGRDLLQERALSRIQM